MINPTAIQAQQLELIRKQQLLNQGDTKGGYFDQLGATQRPMGDPRELMRQQLIWQNLQNPNQIQGSANNAGLMLGQALSRIFSGGKEQAPQADRSEQIRMQAMQKYAQLIKQKTSPDKAMYQVATEYITQGADLKDAEMMSAGNQMLQDWRSFAKDIKTINEFTPINMVDKNGKEIMAKTEAQMNALIDAGFVKAGEKSINNDYMTRVRHDGTQMVNEESFDGGKSWREFGRGTNTQLTGTAPASKIADRMDEFTAAVSTTNSGIDLIDGIQSRLKSNDVSGTNWGRQIVGLAGGISGTIKALAPGMDSSVMDPSNYQDVLGGNKRAITEAGLTEASLVRLATMLAAQERFASGESNRTSVADVKMKLKALGGTLSDPEAFAAVLEDVKQGMVKNLGNKIEADPEFDSYRWGKGIKDRYKKIQERVKPKSQHPADITDILNRY